MNASGTAWIMLPRAVLPLFAATLYISAGLMFLVEPMVAKMVLPLLGGSPAVWSTCLVFFQATLLLGYAYAHALTRVAPRRAQILIHVAVLFLAALSLPLNIGANLPSQGAWPALSLLVHLTLVARAPSFSRSRPPRRSSKVVFPISIMKPRVIPISCMPVATPAACSRCCPILFW